MSFARLRVLLVSAVACLVIALGVSSQRPGHADSFTQNDLAKMMVRVLGVEGQVPTAPLAEDYFNVLTTMGIAPLDGWYADEPVSRQDLAVVMVQALGLKGEVEDSMDPAAYVDVLRSEGIVLEKGIAKIDHALSFPDIMNSFDALNYGSSVSDRFETSLSPIGTNTGF